MSEKLVFRILDFIHPDLGKVDEISPEVFDLVDSFVERYFYQGFCQRLIDIVDEDVDMRKVARVLDLLVWSTPDNGFKLTELTDSWLRSSDLRKIKAILYRKDWLPDENSWKEESLNILRVDPKLKSLINYYKEELLYSKKTSLRNIEQLNEICKRVG